MMASFVQNTNSVKKSDLNIIKYSVSLLFAFLLLLHIFVKIKVQKLVIIIVTKFEN